MTLIVKSPVWDDLRKIGKRIAKNNRDAADRFFTAAEQTFELLSQHPRIGRVRSFSIPGVRSWAVSGFPNYLIFYLPTATEIQILAVLHGARDLPRVIEERLE